ncbi:MAG: SpoIVB peptidase S55 domain-containing protein [Lawsonibacter sp.]
MKNSKPVGVITYVLVNDPTRGYGIFIEHMLKGVEQ